MRCCDHINWYLRVLESFLHNTREVSLAINKTLDSFCYIHISMVDDINLVISLHITHSKQAMLIKICN